MNCQSAFIVCVLNAVFSVFAKRCQVSRLKIKHSSVIYSIACTSFKGVQRSVALSSVSTKFLGIKAVDVNKKRMSYEIVFDSLCVISIRLHTRVRPECVEICQVTPSAESDGFDRFKTGSNVKICQLKFHTASVQFARRNFSGLSMD
jgi:hypothetical protein